MDDLVEMTTGSPTEVLQCLREVGMPSKLPSEFPMNVDLCVFRSGVVPMWEDNGHANGGRLKLKILEETEIDAVWIRTLMMLFYRRDLQSVSGVYMQVRRNWFSVSLWFQGFEQVLPQRLMEIARSWQGSLGLWQGSLKYMRARTEKGFGEKVSVLEWCI